MKKAHTIPIITAIVAASCTMLYSRSMEATVPYAKTTSPEDQAICTQVASPGTQAVCTQAASPDIQDIVPYNETPEAGVPLELAKWRSLTYGNVRYRLHFNIPEKRSERVTGTITVSLVLEAPADIVLDFREPASSIRSVKVNSPAEVNSSVRVNSPAEGNDSRHNKGSNGNSGSDNRGDGSTDGHGLSGMTGRETGPLTAGTGGHAPSGMTEGETGPLTAGTMQCTVQHEHIIVPAELTKAGENTVEIVFTAGDQSLNRNDDFLYTLLVPDRARTLFPCFDQPDIKALYTLSLEVPADWKAVSNTYIAREEDIAPNNGNAPAEHSPAEDKAGVSTGTAPANITATGMSTGTAATNITAIGMSTGTVPANITETGMDTGTTSANITATGMDTGTTSANITATGMDTGTAPANITTTGMDTGTTPANITATGMDTGTAATNITAIGMSTGTVAADITATEVSAGTASMNGSAASRCSDEAEDAGCGSPRRLITFSETEPLSTYLFSFVAGEFFRRDYDDGRHRFSAYYRETDTAKTAQLDDIFAQVAASLEWMEDYTGIPYPFAKYDFIILPGFQYGGMEHTGATLYNDGRMFLGPNPTLSDRLSRTELIAHETAHMWFGDLVTMKWFDEVWTKEVFANHFAAWISEPLYPDVNHRLNRLRSFNTAALSEDRTAGTVSISQELPNLNYAGLVYGQIIYNKAPVMMEKLIGIMGQDAFREGIRTYLKRYSYGNATWDDLVGILDSLTSADLRGFSRAWVYEKGMPDITFSLGCKSASRPGSTGMATANEQGDKPLVLTVTQTDPQGRDLLWPQSFEVTVTDGNGHFCRTEVELGSTASVSIPLPLPSCPAGHFPEAHADYAGCSATSVLPYSQHPSGHSWDSLSGITDGIGPDGHNSSPDGHTSSHDRHTSSPGDGNCPDRYYILPNTDGLGYGRFILPPATARWLLGHWPEIQDGTARFSTLMNLQENYLAGLISARDWSRSILAGLAGETDQLTASSLTGFLGWTLDDLSRTDRERAEQQLWHIARTHPEKAIRTILMRSLPSGITSAPLCDSLYAIWADRSEPLYSENDYTALAWELAIRFPDRAWDILRTQRERLTDPDRLRRFDYVSRALNPDESARDTLFQSLMQAGNRRIEPWTASVLGYLNHPLREASSVKYIRPGLDILEEVQRTGDIFFPRNWAGALLGGHRSHEAWQEVQTFLEDRQDCPALLRNKILQAAYPLFRANTSATVRTAPEDSVIYARTMQTILGQSCRMQTISSRQGIQQPTQPSGTQTSGAQSSGTQPSGTQPSGTQTSGAQSSGTQPSGAQPSRAQSSGTQSSGTQSSGTQPSGSSLSGQQPDHPISGTRPASLSRNCPTSGDHMILAAKALYGTPYVGGTLESVPEALTVNLRETDCILFVEACTAMVLLAQEHLHDTCCAARYQDLCGPESAEGHSPTDRSPYVQPSDPECALPPETPCIPPYSRFCDMIRTLRYRNGIVSGYPSRLHYTSEWLLQAQRNGILREVTREIGGVPLNQEFSFMSSHRDNYPQLRKDPEAWERIRRAERQLDTATAYYCIPSGKIPEVEDSIQDGDIICFVSKTPGLDITHVGIACRDEDGSLHFIHASMREGKVVFEKKTLAEYAGNGIRVARLR